MQEIINGKTVENILQVFFHIHCVCLKFYLRILFFFLSNFDHKISSNKSEVFKCSFEFEIAARLYRKLKIL